MESNIYQQEGLAMRLPLSLILTYVYMEYFEDMIVGSTPLVLSFGLIYVDDTFILWLHQEDVRTLVNQVNSIRPSILFSMEKKTQQITFPR